MKQYGYLQCYGCESLSNDQPYTGSDEAVECSCGAMHGIIKEDKTGYIEHFCSAYGHRFYPILGRPDYCDKFDKKKRGGGY